MTIAADLINATLPADELTARAFKLAKWADQAIDSDTAELTFPDYSGIRIKIEYIAPPLYELCFFVGSYYDDSYTEAKNSGAIYKSGFKLLKSELAANKQQLQLLQRIADTTEQAINSKQTNVIAVLLNCDDSDDMLHLHEHI